LRPKTDQIKRKE